MGVFMWRLPATIVMGVNDKLMSVGWDGHLGWFDLFSNDCVHYHKEEE